MLAPRFSPSSPPPSWWPARRHDAGAQSISDLNSQISLCPVAGPKPRGRRQRQGCPSRRRSAAGPVAAAREAQLTGVLAQGEQRQADLEGRVRQARSHLARTRAHLRRALAALSERLVSIYKGNAPDRPSSCSAPRASTTSRTAPSSWAGSRTPTHRLPLRFESFATRSQPSWLRCAMPRRSRLRSISGSPRRATRSLGAGQRRGAGRAARAGAPARGRGCVEPSLAGFGLGAAGDPAAAGAGSRKPAGRLLLRSADRLELGRQLGDPGGHRDVRVGRELQRREPVIGCRRRLPDPSLDLEPLRRERRSAGRLAAEQSRIAAQIWSDSGSGAWVCAQ